jgi:hypothetical protein
MESWWASCGVRTDSRGDADGKTDEEEDGAEGSGLLQPPASSANTELMLPEYDEVDENRVSE